MNKGWLSVLLLGCCLIGCKAKRKLIKEDTPRSGRTVSTTRTAKMPFYEDNGVYALPKDTGKFVRMDIGSPQEYIDTFSEIAQMEMKAYGIPASITLAQGLLESGFGKGDLAIRTNNHFGIKCHKGWDGDRDYYDDDLKGECFRKYNHPMYSFRDHSLFLYRRSRYADLFELEGDDYRRWAKGLKQAGYATDRKYPQKLIALIERYRLYDYDRLFLDQRLVQRGSGTSVSGTTHIVEKGDTLYSISKRYGTTVGRLQEWNQMEGTTISIGQKLTIRPRRVHK